LEIGSGPSRTSSPGYLRASNSNAHFELVASCGTSPHHSRPCTHRRTITLLASRKRIWPWKQFGEYFGGFVNTVDGGRSKDSKPESPHVLTGNEQPQISHRSWVVRRVPTVVAAVLAAILLILTTILVLNNGALPFRTTVSEENPIIIEINGVDRQLVYKGNWGGYFGPTTNDSCAFCPVGAQAGAAIRIPLVTWYPPVNLSFWVFTNVSGPFPVQGAGCSPAPCVFPWLSVESLETYVPADTLSSMTLFGVFLLPNTPSSLTNVIDFNATLCPISICPAPTL